VIPVRLALLTEMVKGRSWTTATLKEIGGTQGVGVAFLDETLNSVTLRHHQKAARALLKSLLPEPGTDIKGNMRPRRALLEASGYQQRPREFEDLLRILDSEVRLITPTDPDRSDSDSRVNHLSGSKYYQLTHDYLVPSLNDWLTRKQRETWHGRAQLRLFDRAAAWNARPEKQQLPSLMEYLGIVLFTRRDTWTKPQRLMMKQKLRVASNRLCLIIAIATGALFLIIPVTVSYPSLLTRLPVVIAVVYVALRISTFLYFLARDFWEKHTRQEIRDPPSAIV
jgi:eukaryotic-like serine/threonine-protein kinase